MPHHDREPFEFVGEPVHEQQEAGRDASLAPHMDFHQEMSHPEPDLVQLQFPERDVEQPNGRRPLHQLLPIIAPGDIAPTTFRILDYNTLLAIDDLSFLRTDVRLPSEFTATGAFADTSAMTELETIAFLKEEEDEGVAFQETDEDDKNGEAGNGEGEEDGEKQADDGEDEETKNCTKSEDHIVTIVILGTSTSQQPGEDPEAPAGKPIDHIPNNVTRELAGKPYTMTEKVQSVDGKNFVTRTKVENPKVKDGDDLSDDEREAGIVAIVTFDLVISWPCHVLTEHHTVIFMKPSGNMGFVADMIKGMKMGATQGLSVQVVFAGHSGDVQKVDWNTLSKIATDTLAVYACAAGDLEVKANGGTTKMSDIAITTGGRLPADVEVSQDYTRDVINWGAGAASRLYNSKVPTINRKQKGTRISKVNKPKKKGTVTRTRTRRESFRRP